MDAEKNNRMENSGSEKDWKINVKKWGWFTADVGKMKIKNWIEMTVDREAWKKIVELFKPHEELQRQQENIYCWLILKII